MTGFPQTDESFLASSDAARWRDILSRITNHRAVELDELTGSLDPGYRVNKGRSFFPDVSIIPICDPGDGSRTAIGVRISDTEQDLSALAARLAALAIEQDCEVVTLSEQPLSGLERFGFRNERIAGETEEQRAACIEQIRAIWGLEFVI